MAPSRSWPARSPRGERWWLLVLEGSVNLGVAGVILIWPAIVAVPCLDLASAWAIVTGALMLAAARRLSLAHGQTLLLVAGIVSAGWGVLVPGVGPSAGGDPRRPAGCARGPVARSLGPPLPAPRGRRGGGGEPAPTGPS